MGVFSNIDNLTFTESVSVVCDILRHIEKQHGHSASRIAACVAAEMTTAQKVSDVLYGRTIEAMADSMPAVLATPNPPNG